MGENTWVLEGVAADGSRVRHELNQFPCHIGRDPGNELVVPSSGLSRRHAEFQLDVTGQLRLVDLNSSNGSFVNRERINGSVLLTEGDVLHFATVEFRLLRRGSFQETAPYEDIGRTVIVPSGLSLPAHFVPKERQFFEFLQGKGLSGAIQPIVQARGGQLFAWELLGRSTHPELPSSPIRLFNMATQLGREVELSAALREFGVRSLAPHARDMPLFVNTHPKETFEESFLESLARLQQDCPQLQLVVEIHENAVMEVDRMRELAARLNDMGLRFAYDDFGAGQARLNELGDVPPHFVKFDMGLVHDIHLASERKQLVVADLVKLVHELGSQALAEGVELEQEAAVCRQMGFDLIQGYLTGRPGPLPGG